MIIEPGVTLGHYRLVEKLGEGGMGQVWLAQDVRLEREVAVKILPPGFAGSEQHLARFEREGKAISALNHPHICTLHDVGQDGETRFLVMERIEGESLRKRLNRGPLPLDQVLELGAQIASALDAAHRLGIVHRDLKPDNIMLTRTGAKLLDFGLAKPILSPAGAPPEGATALPTQGGPLTQEGMILGTFQYMAPEQLEGQETDARTDIFALGALLFEMATGRKAFDGKTNTSLIAAIVTSQPPPISQLTNMTPPVLDHLVAKCLAKEADERWHSAGDIAAQLRWIASQSQAAQAVSLPGAGATPGRLRTALPWALAAILGLVAAGLALLGLGTEAGPQRLLRASLTAPPDTALIPFDYLGVALSPDGSRLAFAANDADGGQRIWVRDLSAMTAEAVPESQGGAYPFWSPDGNHLGFFADGKLKRIDLRGGSPRELADAPSGRGGSWGTDDTIFFAPNIRTSIHEVPAAGGAAREVTQYDPEHETTHRWPVALPDGEHFLYVSRLITETGHVGRLMLGDRSAGTAKVLVEDATNASYVTPGYLVFGRAGDLLAQPFDAHRGELSGEPVPVTTEKVSYWQAKDLVIFAAANDGTIIYLPEVSRRSELRWYDRTGRPLGTLGKPDYYFDPRISFDGKKVAFVRGRSQSERQDLWVHDLAYARELRLTQETTQYASPRWSRDGTRVAFVCRPRSVQDICVKRVGDASPVEMLYESPNWNESGSWSPDGNRFLLSDQNPETGMDIWSVEPGKPDTARLLVATPFEETSAELSPDGAWFLYASDETGRFEVYLRRAAEASQQWQVSVDGGMQPRWRSDGSEVYFIAADGTLMAVAIETSPVLRVGAPEPLFSLSERPDGSTPLFEDVTPDGKRFLMNQPIESRTSVGFHAIFHWTALVEP